MHDHVPIVGTFYKSANASAASALIYGQTPKPRELRDLMALSCSGSDGATNSSWGGGGGGGGGGGVRGINL